MQLLSYINEPAPALAVRRLAQMAPQYEALFMRLAEETGIYIIGGTHPVFQRGKIFNAAHLFTPNGRVFRQKKVHLTSTESGPYQFSRGHGLYLYHTDFGNIAILICYDVEFPELARVMAEAGAEILFVPSCTDGREGFCRVRYCAQARAIENQVYVAMTGTVGNLPLVPYMAPTTDRPPSSPPRITSSPGMESPPKAPSTRNKWWWPTSISICWTNSASTAASFRSRT